MKISNAIFFDLQKSVLSTSDQLFQIRHRVLNTNCDDERTQEWQYSYNNKYGNLKQMKSVQNYYIKKNAWMLSPSITAQKMKFSIKDFYSKCDQIRRKLRIWSHLLKKSLMENFIFCAVNQVFQCERFKLYRWFWLLLYNVIPS